jgi:hypothetical protein
LSIDFFQNEISNLRKFFEKKKERDREREKEEIQLFNLDFESNDNIILSYFYDFQRQIRCICKMINIIYMQNLSKENFSCLNTTLVIIMLANKKDQLPKYLKAIKMKPIKNTTTSTTGFIDLL